MSSAWRRGGIDLSTVVSRFDDFVGMPVREFVLHRKPMLLLDTVVMCAGDKMECEWQVSAEDVFVVPGRGVPAYIGVEYMAQCVAALGGARARLEGFGPPLGFLLGTRHFTATRSHFELGMRYVASCTELVRDANGMGSYDCSIKHGDEVLAMARLSVFEKERGERLR